MKIKCESCKELKELIGKSDAITVYEVKTVKFGYVCPNAEIVIKFCPMCGKKLVND